MGVPVLVLGESGSGKSYSLKQFSPEEVGVFSVEKGRLPFKNHLKVCRNAGYGKILSALREPKLKAYVIDDSQYLMVNEFFDRAKEAGYQKYTDIGLHFRNLVHFINQDVPDDVVVYFLHHTQMDESGVAKAKTVGKLLDNYLTVEGCFDLVLRCVSEGQEHFFLTQNDGSDTVKTPEGMFEQSRVPNDLKAVDTAIRDYWEI